MFVVKINEFLRPPYTAYGGWRRELNRQAFASSICIIIVNKIWF